MISLLQMNEARDCSSGEPRAFIAEHEEVKGKILAELDMNGLLVTAKRPQPRSITYNDALKLPFLAATIKVRPLNLLIISTN